MSVKKIGKAQINCHYNFFGNVGFKLEVSNNNFYPNKIEIPSEIKTLGESPKIPGFHKKPPREYPRGNEFEKWEKERKDYLDSDGYKQEKAQYDKLIEEYKKKNTPEWILNRLSRTKK